MPIHNVGYRTWEGLTESPWLRWTVIAGAGMRLGWKSSWLRRMLLFSWMPAALVGMGFFVYEQSLEHRQWQRAIPFIIDWYPGASMGPESQIANSAKEAFRQDPAGARHEIWSLLLMSFFRYPQGVVMVMLVGMIAPALISQDFRSRAFLLYFSRPITPGEYIFGKAMVLWVYLAAVTTLPALLLYALGVLLSPSVSVVLYTWDLPFRILAASLVLMVPTTSLALFFSSMTTESRYAGFAWFAVWGLGWTAWVNLQAFSAGKQWSMLSLYHMLGRVQTWVFGLPINSNDVTAAAILLIVITVFPLFVLVNRVSAPMRI